ncbi:hypothetical protein EDI_238270 [Entamoeba dispar SAW760]|uniref:Pre-rRNA-processing protein Ipi1 N-terminal domain-containing protein n=1 Tax=Entamoeba dispar (strain ATCC PRA-260 / SAW760) TaxID=370354 RepID=B0E8D4_ENTDS|nr:uncharacterized protein EDI_238270 [Entamoeba dispar SAW760]EDR29259.1 hypothetical protein EDI_238270 [Entamoeba dispar SAW760]|eukprot:EDR29259.1 hypothetical protein EDI_238270 [Entamoeba dispar SAW760]
MPKSKPKDFAKKKSVIGQKNAPKSQTPIVKSKVLKMRDQAIADASNEISEALRGIQLPSEKSRVNCLKLFQRHIKSYSDLHPTIITKIISSSFPLITDLSPLVRDAAMKFVLTYIDIFGTKGTKLSRKYSDLLFTQLELGLSHSWSSIRVEILQFIEKVLTKGITVLYNKEEALMNCLLKYSENALKSVTDFTMKDVALECYNRLKIAYEKRKLEEFETAKIKTVEMKFEENQWCGVVFDDTTFNRTFVNEWVL